MSLLDLLIIIILINWFGGAFIWPIGGAAIHLLLVIVLILVVLRLLQIP